MLVNKLKVHARDIRLQQPEKSGLVEHCVLCKHRQPHWEEVRVMARIDLF